MIVCIALSAAKNKPLLSVLAKAGATVKALYISFQTVNIAPRLHWATISMMPASATESP